MVGSAFVTLYVAVCRVRGVMHPLVVGVFSWFEFILTLVVLAFCIQFFL